MNSLQPKIDIVRQYAVVGLPANTVVPYCGLIDSSTHFIIYHPERDWDYSSFHCLMRPAGCPEFVEVEIEKVTRYRDGGTTDIETQGGDFHFPSPFNPEDKPTFAGREIIVLKT